MKTETNNLGEIICYFDEQRIKAAMRYYMLNALEINLDGYDLRFDLEGIRLVMDNSEIKMIAVPSNATLSHDVDIPQEIKDRMNKDRNDAELHQEQFNHLQTRISWDATIAERDELKAAVKALSAIRKGLEKSLTDALDKISELELDRTTPESDGKQ